MKGYATHIIARRNRLHRKALRSKTEKDWEIYRKARNQATWSIKSAKRFYYERLIKDDQCGRISWRLLNSFMGKRQNHAISLISDGCSTATDTQAICELFNEYTFFP